MAAKKTSTKTRSKAADSETARPSLRERQREMTREALLAGAAEAFAEHRYNDVTIDHIVQRAGTSRGTFYLYFTKGEALAELIERAFVHDIGGTRGTGLFADLHMAAPYTVDSLEEWLKGYLEVWRRHSSLVRAWMEGDATDPEVEALTLRRVRRAREILTAVLIEQAVSAGRQVDEPMLRSRAAIMDLELQYFCFLTAVRDFEVDAGLGLRAVAEQWNSTIHRA